MNSQTKNKILKLIQVFNNGYIFERQDISSITGESVTTAGILISRLKKAGLIESVSGHGKGKHRFKEIADSSIEN